MKIRLAIINEETGEAQHPIELDKVAIWHAIIEAKFLIARLEALNSVEEVKV